MDSRLFVALIIVNAVVYTIIAAINGLAGASFGPSGKQITHISALIHWKDFQLPSTRFFNFKFQLTNCLNGGIRNQPILNISVKLIFEHFYIEFKWGGVTKGILAKSLTLR